MQDAMIKFSDQEGQAGSLRFHVPDGFTPAGIESTLYPLLLAVSAAAITGAVVTSLSSTTQGAIDIDDEFYPNAEDKLKVEYLDAFGGKHSIELPAPRELLFLDDSESVDTTQALWTAFVAAFEAVAKGSNGQAVTVVRGYRTRVSR